MYEDKTLVCRDCGQEFVFTAGEQEFYAEKGLPSGSQGQPSGSWRSPRDLHHHVCELRRRDHCSLHSQERPPHLLQRVLRRDASVIIPSQRSLRPSQEMGRL